MIDESIIAVGKCFFSFQTIDNILEAGQCTADPVLTINRFTGMNNVCFRIKIMTDR